MAVPSVHTDPGRRRCCRGTPLPSGGTSDNQQWMMGPSGGSASRSMESESSHVRRNADSSLRGFMDIFGLRICTFYLVRKLISHIVLLIYECFGLTLVL